MKLDMHKITLRRNVGCGMHPTSLQGRGGLATSRARNGIIFAQMKHFATALCMACAATNEAEGDDKEVAERSDGTR